MQVVVRKLNSHVTTTDIDSERLKQNSNKTDNKTYYKNVYVTLLRTDWIYNNGTDMDDLVMAMSNANDELFKTDLFNVLIGGFWTTYYKRLVFFGFIPWIVYTILALVYFSICLHPDPGEQ